MRSLKIIFISMLLTACTGLPSGIKPVDSFNLSEYLGTWYEIARLDHSFERGLEQITATYSMRDDGGVKVLNKGFNTENQEWKEAEGKAYFIGEPNIAHLKVSFFGPFYGSYVLFYLSDDKQHAYVTSHNRDFLWYLSREPHPQETMKEHFLSTASSYGFDTKALIWVTHEK